MAKPGAIPAAQYYDTHDPMHVARLARDSAGGGEVLLVGGGDHQVGISSSSYPDSWGHLEGWARGVWGDALGATKFKWSGQVGGCVGWGRRCCRVASCCCCCRLLVLALRHVNQYSTMLAVHGRQRPASSLAGTRPCMPAGALLWSHLTRHAALLAAVAVSCPSM